MTELSHDAAEAFFQFMTKRHRIWEQREAGRPKPWTDDPVLLDYKFCNVFRELDTVTIWIREHIREPFYDHPNLWFMLCIARQINWPDTLQDMMAHKAWPFIDRWDSVHAGTVLDERKAAGQKVYTGAYMIRAESDKRKPWYSWTKQQYMTQIVLGKVWERRTAFDAMFDTPKQPSLQQVHNWLTKFHGWGGFMAYEVVTDLRHTRYLRHAPDIMTWANPGPGAKRGLNRLFQRPLKFQQGDSLFNFEMRILLKMADMYWEGPALEMREIEHTLCEFDKYERVRLGEGKPRAKYNGRQR